MDRQAAELRRDLAGAEVERVGEGIRITLSWGILFDRGSATLRPAAEGELRELAGVLKEYEETDIPLVGHTDSTGSEEYNERLSERRAAFAREASTARSSANLPCDPAKDRGKCCSSRLRETVHSCRNQEESPRLRGGHQHSVGTTFGVC
jgi:hypothetical protein